MAPLRITAVAFFLGAAVVPAAAQTLEPLRSAPPRAEDRTSQELVITASALGGYDDHLAPFGAGSVESLEASDSGYTGLADVNVRYRRGRRAREFSLDGSTYLLSYSNMRIDSPVGGQIRVGGFTTFGRLHRAQFMQQVRTDPYVTFGAFTPIRPDIGPGTGPDANPTNGLGPQRSWGSFTSASVDWRLKARTTFSTAYEYSRHEFIGLGGYDNRAHKARLSYQRSFSRTLAARASYKYGDTQVIQTLQEGSLPLVEHTAEMGFDYTKGLSRTRKLEISGGAGATHVDTLSQFGNTPIKEWTPSGYASARTDIGRTWALSGTYRRGVTFLDGITPEFFLADVFFVQAQGLLERRLQLDFSAGYSNGAQPISGLSNGRYDTFTAVAEARYVIVRSWAVTASYNRSNYRLYGFPPPPAGPEPRFDRNAIRIGMTYLFTLNPRAPRPTRPGRTED
jgi:hypothetical protein